MSEMKKKGKRYLTPFSFPFSFGGRIEAMDSFNDIRDALLAEPEGTLIITMGAGDIYKVAEEIVSG